MYHYVYRIEHIETGEFYIGSRSSKKHPSLDNYLGSMKVWNPDKTKLKKTILKDDFLDRESAIIFESKQIMSNIENNLNRNYNVPSSGFHTNGTVTVRDKSNNISQVSINDPRYLSGELVGSTKGMIPVKNMYGETLQVSINDPRFLSGELVGISKNMIPVRDKDNNILHVSIDDPRYLNGELLFILKGLINVKDKDGFLSCVSIDDPRYLSGELKVIWFGKKHTMESRNKMSISSKGKGMGKNNSQYGTCWITLNGENRKIQKDDLKNYLESGWVKGRFLKKN